MAMTGKEVSNTFITLPDARMPTAIGAALAQRRAEDTRLVDRTIIAAAPASPYPRPASDGGPTVISSAGRQTGHTTTVINPSSASPRSAYGGFRKSLPRGFQVHNYRIDEPIGEGGFAITYRATDTRVERQVALKELFLNDQCARADDLSIVSTAADSMDTFKWALWFFSEEARITSALRHQGIVTMLEFFKTNGTAYIAYQLLTGSDLARWAESRKHELPQADAVELLRRCAQALGFVHKRGFVHGDVKPANVFMDAESSAPVLIDFGSSASIGEPRRGQYVAVSPGFSPVEQYSRTSIPDPRLDIYSLCATVFWTLTGRAPPEATTRAAEGPSLSLATPGTADFRFGGRLARVLEKGLSVKPEDRYPSTEALLDDLFPKVYLSASGYASTPRGDKVFVSYRREDSAHFSGRLLDFLELRLGSDQVFFDAMSIPHGMDFWDYIKSNLQDCAVLLAIIGPKWTDMLSDRRRRWYTPWKARDYVADEIRAALELELPILPVLFDGAGMPRARDLPADLRAITALNAAIIGAGKAFRIGADGLCDQIVKIRSDFYAKRG